MDTDIISIESEKASSLTLLNEDQKNVIISAVKYNSIPYMPITAKFMRQIILNNGEYPLIESKISQAATEMRSRFNQLVDAQYNYNKELLEIEELELDIKDIELSDISGERKSIAVRKKKLELQMKHFRKESVKVTVSSLYDEFKNWKDTVEFFIEEVKKQDPSVTSYEDVRYNEIREKEILIKTHRLAQAANQGAQLSQSEEKHLLNMAMDSSMGIKLNFDTSNQPKITG